MGDSLYFYYFLVLTVYFWLIHVEVRLYSSTSVALLFLAMGVFWSTAYDFWCSTHYFLAITTRPNGTYMLAAHIKNHRQLYAEKKLCPILLSTTNNLQRFIIFFIIVYALTCFGRFLRPSSGAQELYTQHLVAVAASKPGTYQMVCVQFLSS